MRTIYVILAEKQYSSSKVIAAFDTQEGADKMKDIIEGVEPRFTLSVHPIEMHVAPPKTLTVTIKNTPDVHWNGTPLRVTPDGDDFVAEHPDGGPITGLPHAADPPEAFIPENPDGPGAA